MATDVQIREIIDRIAPACQKYAKKYGYKVCSPAIAQALQEGLGKSSQPMGLSTLAYKYNNYHGIKTYPKWTGKSVNMKTGEEVNNALVYINSNFCVFDNLDDAMEQYFVFLERNPRYKPVKACSTPYEYLSTIKACKYCTDSSYVVNCLNKITKYNLTQYDDTPAKASRYEVGKVYTTLVNLNIRKEPNGEKVKYECVTADAKKNGYFDSYGNAVLYENTRVTCQAVEERLGETWIKIPSGWLCAVTSTGRVYINDSE